MKLCLIVSCGAGLMYQSFPLSIEEAEEKLLRVKPQGNAVLLDNEFNVIAIWKKEMNFEFDNEDIRTTSLSDFDNLVWERQ